MNDSEPQRILIIEDEDFFLSLIVEILGDYGFDLMTAKNGEEGLVRAREGQPDLILLDILMPKMDGFAVCARLKSDPATRNIPIVFLTSLTDTEQKLRAFQLGGVDYITKPFEPREVLARVILHLDQYRLCQRLKQRLEAYERAGLASPDMDKSPAEQAKSLVRISSYLRENIAHTPNLDELARIGATNRTSLNHDFQRLYGMSVFEWLREQRLMHAAYLLRTTERQVLDIAQSVGYTSHGGFIAAFRLRFSATPREYRASEVH